MQNRQRKTTWASLNLQYLHTAATSTKSKLYSMKNRNLKLSLLLAILRTAFLSKTKTQSLRLQVIMFKMLMIHI